MSPLASDEIFVQPLLYRLFVLAASLCSGDFSEKECSNLPFLVLALSCTAPLAITRSAPKVFGNRVEGARRFTVPCTSCADCPGKPYVDIFMARSMHDASEVKIDILGQGQSQFVYVDRSARQQPKP